MQNAELKRSQKQKTVFPKKKCKRLKLANFTILHFSKKSGNTGLQRDYLIMSANKPVLKAAEPKSLENKKPSSRRKMVQYLEERTSRLTLVSWLVRNSQSLTTFTATCSQYFATVLRCHTATESVFVFSFSYGRLKRSFHDSISLNEFLFLNCGVQR